VRIRSVLSHSAQAIAEGALISLLVVGLIAGSAFAAKGGNSGTGSHHGGSSGAGACSVTPNPTAVGATFTVSGTGLTPGEMIDVYVANWHGGTWYFAGVSSTGSFSATGWADWAGTQTVSVYDMYATRGGVLASCSFSVV